LPDFCLRMSVRVPHYVPDVRSSSRPLASFFDSPENITMTSLVQAPLSAPATVDQSVLAEVLYRRCSSSSRHPSAPATVDQFVLAEVLCCYPFDFSSTRPPCHIGRMVCINEGGRTDGGPVIESFLRMRDERDRRKPKMMKPSLSGYTGAPLFFRLQRHL